MQVMMSTYFNVMHKNKVFFCYKWLIALKTKTYLFLLQPKNINWRKKKRKLSIVFWQSRIKNKRNDANESKVQMSHSRGKRLGKWRPLRFCYTYQFQFHCPIINQYVLVSYHVHVLIKVRVLVQFNYRFCLDYPEQFGRQEIFFIYESCLVCCYIDKDVF